MSLDSSKKVPVLRFRDDEGKEYPEWKVEEFSKLVDKVTESYRPSKSETIRCIELENLASGTGILLDVSITTNQKSLKTKFLSGDVLFGKLRPYLRKYYLATFDGVCTTEIWVFRAKDIESRYLYFVVQTDAFFRVANFQFGTKMPRSDWRVVAGLKIQIPSSKQEQQKIASFLSSVDTRIEQLEKKKSLFEQYKKSLMQKLFSQEIRFKDDQGEEYPEWEMSKILLVFSERREIGRPDHEMLSVTISDGVVRASDLGRRDTSSVDKSKYKRVAIGDIPYNSMRMWQGASGVSEFDGIVSPAYTVLNPKDGQVSQYWGYCFKLKRVLHLFQRFSQGLTSDNWNLKYPAISQIKVSVPTEEEQQKIAEFFSSIDRKIELISKQISQTREFKKGLLQQMFV